VLALAVPKSASDRTPAAAIFMTFMGATFEKNFANTAELRIGELNNHTPPRGEIF
jgi:hypothetical protein